MIKKINANIGYYHLTFKKQQATTHTQATEHHDTYSTNQQLQAAKIKQNHKTISNQEQTIKQFCKSAEEFHLIRTLNMQHNAELKAQ